MADSGAVDSIGYHYVFFNGMAKTRHQTNGIRYNLPIAVCGGVAEKGFAVTYYLGYDRCCTLYV